MRKSKRYADGGMTFVLGANQPTASGQDPTLSTSGGASGAYPFGGGTSSGGTGSANTTTTNVNVGGQAAPSEPATLFKRGGVVKGRRGDGICQRGHTKGRMV